MPVAVTVRAEVTAHFRLDVPVVHLHVHYLHEFDSRGQLLDLLLGAQSERRYFTSTREEEARLGER